MTTREQALDAMVSILQGITTGNGYPVSVGLVQRNLREILLYENAYPAIGVIDGGEEDIKYKTSYVADVYFTVKLHCWVRSRTQMSEAMNALDLSIKKAIGADVTLGGVVAHATILGDIDKDLSGDDDVAKFIRPVRIFYEGSTSGGM